MCLNAKLTSYSVTHDAISVHLNCRESDGDAIHGLMSDKVPKMFHFTGLSVKGTVVSINIRNGISLLLKLPKAEYVVRGLWRLSMVETIRLTVEGEIERRLTNLLKNVSAETGNTEDELLYELSTFTNKEKLVIEGKRVIAELSPKAQEVVLRKLEKVHAN